ncbi:aminotransferase class I/II-fold pyridoxal phosphate-dependent enzyme [Corynebacterium ammoniagenes]|uniref:MalY/PatB family protein n=1 Tax=Corynebacterium ammoniagenes TaxID=1697 RepID=UPI0014593AAF|nr:aminotransferase class I/II-fold pyridoxal phosphate-dependent enzyme [Corynebacterium ammoniagenes]NMF31917.1 aminotransferase class I/II-fold pyridoxal phosphate-dependent enzyme [Corynebacterium ammoniagenes]
MKFPTQDELRSRFTRKWTQFEPDVLPLFIAESDFPTAPAVKKVLLDYTERECFGYSPAPGAVGLGDAVADFHESRYGWRPDPKKVFWIGDVVRGLLLGIQYFTRPDSPVVVPLPAYPPFLELPETAGRERIDVGVTPSNGDVQPGEKPRLDLEAIEHAFADGAGSILLANPFNPLGYVFDEDHLRELVALADKYDARILSDEIHAPLVLNGQHISIAGLSDTAARVTMTITATSKAWNFAGLKCAQIIFSNDKDVETWNSLPHVAQDGVGTLGIIAAEAAYRDGISHLDEEVEYLCTTRDWLVEELPKRIPGLITSKPDSTYLMWLDFRNTAIGEKEYPAAWLVQHARVAFNEGVTFGEGFTGQARLNFATSPEILEEAIDRVAQAIAKADA